MLINILIVFLFLIALVLLLWQISNLIAICSGCLYVKADKENVRQVLTDFAKKDSIFYDLGSGNGEILILANDFQMKVTGFEIAPFYYIVSRLRTIFKKDIRVKYGNILKADLSSADIIYCYLLPALLQKLSIKFLHELKKDAVIISVGFPMNNLKLIREYDIKTRKFFVYKKISWPFRVAFGVEYLFSLTVRDGRKSFCRAPARFPI